MQSSKIDKLSILGVRSFDNQRPETIQFHTPLTLIVGYNGSGKTLCGEKEVLAQVKLSFKGTTGAKMVVTRNLQLTVKKNTRQQKTLEGQLQTMSNGERNSISSRNAELDQIMPQYLGVSKAVLDAVIFCHQDESLWPMSEPGVLKKKFDEIFEALKYTSAIDNIKKLRKTKKEELKHLKTMEQYSKADKDKGDRAEKESKELDAELTALRAETTELQAKAKEADEKFREAHNRATRYKSVVDSLDLKRERQSMHQNNVTQLGQHIKVRTESDEWLQSEADQYEERMAEHHRHKNVQMGQYKDLERNIGESEERLRRKNVEAGKHEEQKANHAQQIERRKTMIKDTSLLHKIRGYDTDLDDMQITEYVERISRLSKDQTAAVEKARKETDCEATKAQDLLNKLGERSSVLKENKKSIKERSAANERKLGTLQLEVNNIEIDEGGKAILDANLEDLDARLKRAKDQSTKGSWDIKIDENEVQRQALEEENEHLTRDLFHGTRQAGVLARLNDLTKDVADHQRNLDKMKVVHNDRLRAIVGHNWEPSRLGNDFQKVIDHKSREVKDAERQREIVSRGLEQVDYKLSNAKTDLKKVEKELAACVEYLHENVEGEPEDYLMTLPVIQQARDQFKADFDNFGNMRKYFTKGISVAQKKHECNLCQRAFHGKEETEYIKRLEAKMASEAAEQVAQDLKEAEDELRKAKEAGPSHDTWMRLSKTELPRLHQDVKRFGADREKLLHEIEDRDMIVNEREEAKRDAESLARPVANIVKYSQDLTNDSGKIKELKAKQNDSGMSRSLEEIQEQLRIVKAKSQGVRNNIAKSRADRDRACSLINALELELSEAKNTISTAEHQLEKKEDISKKLEETRSENRGHRDTIKRLDAQLQELAPQLAEEETKIQDIRQRGSDKANNLQHEAARLLDTVHKLEIADQNIRAYIENGGPSKLAGCQRETESLEQEIFKTKDGQRQVTISINKLSEELNDHKTTKRTIIDNINYRKSLRELENVKAEIASLSEQNAEADQSHWQKQSSHWQRKFDDLKTQKTSKLSAAKVKDIQLEKLLKNWETDYKDAAFKFKKAHIEVETTKAAVEDLGRYAGALDNAIMKYHSIKMEEINRIIEELWRKTYQGTDVDTILIRSDNEAAKGNRSYNYRVCMVKQDTEMDMRGRCSAGQKVLASIIIRLALAECFGVNCGLIALDEPTTNLDRDNIRSLAGSLHDIIENRRHQSNFQLIVITHDEEFLKYMKCPDFCDNYYRVSRDDRQKSQIQRQSIAEVM